MREFGGFSIEAISAGPLMTNSYLLTSGGESLLIDSGAGHREIMEKLSLEGRNVRALIMTHGHFDHIFDAMDFKRELDCGLMIGSDENNIMEWSYSVSERYMGKTIEPIAVDRYLEDGETISLGRETISIISLPGHTGGSIGIIAGSIFLTGDVLFKGTIGRTDIGGSMDEMNKSLRKISRLEENLVVFPGHGPETTLRIELKNNPFLAGMP